MKVALRNRSNRHAYLVGVVHAHSDTTALEVVDIERGWCTTVSWSVDKL